MIVDHFDFRRVGDAEADGVRFAAKVSILYLHPVVFRPATDRIEIVPINQ